MDGIQKKRPKIKQRFGDARKALSSRLRSTKSAPKEGVVEVTQKQSQMQHNFAGSSLSKNSTSSRGNIPKSPTTPPSRQLLYRFLFWSILVLLIIGVLSAAAFFVYRFGAATQQITGTDASISPLNTFTEVASGGDEKNLKGFDDGRVNILLLGVAGTEKPGALLTDTIIMASIDTTTNKVALLSLPRDLLYRYPQGGYVKINSLYTNSLEEDGTADKLLDAVEVMTRQKVHYYLVLDFAGFTEIIDTLGGVNVDVEYAINDERYPGPGFSYEHFTLSKGFQLLDGETALKYARSRYDDPEGDFGRTKRQQKIMQAARNKMFSLGTMLNPFRINELLTALSEHIDTNIAPEEVKSLIGLTKKVDTTNITKVVVDAWKPESLLRSVRVQQDAVPIPGLIPRTGTWDEIQEHAINIFDLEQLALRAAEIKAEETTLTIVNASGDVRAADAVIEALRSRPFAQITKQAAPRNFPQQEQTVVIDHTKQTKPFSLDETLSALDAKRAPQLPKDFTYTTSNAAAIQEKIDASNLVIILGKNVVSRYVYEEASREEVEESNQEDVDVN